MMLHLWPVIVHGLHHAHIYYHTLPCILVLPSSILP